MDAAATLDGRALWCGCRSAKELAKRKGDQEESELLDALSLQELGQISPEALEFALVFPTVSHREPAPSDRDHSAALYKPVRSS